MTRNLTAAVDAELDETEHALIAFFYADFTQPWRTWTGYGTLSWNGADWLGMGDFVKIGESKETIDTGSEALEVILSGVDPARISLALQEPVQGKDIEIWLGFMDAAGNLIPDPWLEYAGTAEFMSPEDDGSSATITLAIETAWASTGATSIRYTNAAQQALYPGDRFFEFAARHSQQPAEWMIK